MTLFILLSIVFNSNIPVLEIETVNHETPTYTVVYAPEGCIGTSITDNKYVSGKMTEERYFFARKGQQQTAGSLRYTPPLRLAPGLPSGEQVLPRLPDRSC